MCVELLINQNRIKETGVNSTHFQARQAVGALFVVLLCADKPRLWEKSDNCGIILLGLWEWTTSPWLNVRFP